ncbi:MAG: ATP-binding protein, partial [Jatrophihabitantaceae bacterium]
SCRPVGRRGWLDLVEILPPDTTALAFTRALLAEAASVLPRGALQDAQLLSCELVANALQHGQPPIVLSMHCSGDGLKVSVSDQAATGPPAVLVLANPDQVSGRGLPIVAELASDWGVTRHRADHGKTVWFEIRGYERD